MTNNLSSSTMNEAKKIVNEKWTDGIAIEYGFSTNHHSIFIGNNSGSISPLSNRTIFDIASVTKLFTLVITMKLVEENIIDLNATIETYTDKFPYIKSIHIFELMNFSVLLQTSTRIDMCSSPTEALQLLYNIKNTNKITTYSDMGAMILTQVLNEALGPNLSFKNYVKKFFKDYQLFNTHWEPISTATNQIQNYDNEYKITNNEILKYHNPIGNPHDIKARLIPYSGHAGIFSTPEDISKFAIALLKGSIISRESLNIITSERYDSFSNNNHYGLLCYKKYNDPRQSEIPSFCSEKSIAISGYTGTYLLLDFDNDFFCFIGTNKIYNRITNSSSIPDNCIYPIVKATRNYVYRKDDILDTLKFIIAHKTF